MDNKDSKEHELNHALNLQHCNELSLVKLIYSTNYKDFLILSNITLEEPNTGSIFLYLKNHSKINSSLEELSWIKSYDDLEELDKYLSENPKQIDFEYVQILFDLKMKKTTFSKQ